MASMPVLVIAPSREGSMEDGVLDLGGGEVVHWRWTEWELGSIHWRVLYWRCAALDSRGTAASSWGTTASSWRTRSTTRSAVLDEGRVSQLVEHQHVSSLLNIAAPANGYLEIRGVIACRVLNAEAVWWLAGNGDGGSVELGRRLQRRLGDGDDDNFLPGLSFCQLLIHRQFVEDT